ncbi:HAD family hydrolase [Marinomonas sp. C2222]|uniref:HAD family hydrolase n=1 Tax=Marinomonas sargassi TaxID=2984494 RepID=A0ABT2YUX7_9GAMM|nr:HAD family hydrolase [Marinomonas sargassi]MCV2403702.1 HAD family hydrolase [Marinomonas sargassi]
MSVLITFDLDDTLWDTYPVLVRAEYAMEAWFEERFPGFSQQFPLTVQREMKGTVLQPSNLTETRLQLYIKMLKQFGLPSEEASLVAGTALEYFKEWRQKVDLFPHALEILEELNQDYSLAVITNGNADVFHPYVGLGRYFDFALRADQVGFAKPNTDIFDLAAQKAGADISNLIHIGDHPIDDVSGVLAAGGKSIWFNRHGARRWADEWRAFPTAEVHSLLELPTAIRSIL